MSALASVINAVEEHGRFVEGQTRKARSDKKFAAELLARWRNISREIKMIETPAGLKLPRLALPQTDEAGEISRFLFEEGMPGEFPFVTAAYPEMYLQNIQTGQGSDLRKRAGKSNDTAVQSEEPTRLFAGLGLAEDTNRRFHYLTQHQKTIRLSTAFDGPTLMEWTATRMVCWEKSERAGLPSIRLKTWSGSMRVSRPALRTFPSR